MKQQNLEAKIEWWLDVLKYAPKESDLFKSSEEIIKNYALEYKELTGDFYRREI